MISCIVYVLYHHLQGFIHHVLSMEWVNHGDMWWDIQPLWGMPGIGNEKQFFTLGSQNNNLPMGYHDNANTNHLQYESPTGILWRFIIGYLYIHV